MTDPLTPARFVALAEAYGGTIARWPEAVRDAAAAMAADPALRVHLETAGMLDTHLDHWRLAAPDAALRRSILKSHRAPMLRRMRMWWAGIGLATALAGAAAGTMAAAALPADRPAEEITVFGALPPAER